LKRYLALIVGMLLVLAMASGAFAETKFTMSGDARVRGIWHSDFDFNEDVDADKRWWDYRVRLAIDAVADGGTKVSTRIAYTGWNDTWADGGNIPQKSSNEPVSMDYAFITVPLGKNFDATLGKVIVGWGKGFMAWDERAYRLILGGKFGDTIVKAFTQKNYETSPGGVATGANTSASSTTVTGDKNLDDNDAYSILAIHKTKNLEIGGIYVYSTNERTTPTTDGSTFNAYFHGKWNSLTAFGEFAVKSGDAPGHDGTAADGSKDAGYGGFLHLDYAMGNVKLIGAVAFTKNGYVADDDFAPTFFYGTTTTPGMMNFGAGGDTTAGVLAVSYQATKELSLMGRVGFASVDAYSTLSTSTPGDYDLTELDLGLTYKINKSTTYAIDFGYLSPDGYNATDDAAIILAHRVVVSF
jgi:hypothetical protein